MYQRPIRLINSLKSYRVYRQTYRQTNTLLKTIFSHSGSLKTWRFDEKRGGLILHKSNTFSDENVKIINQIIFSEGTRKN